MTWDPTANFVRPPPPKMARWSKFAIAFFVGWVAFVLGLGPLIIAWDYSRLGPLHRAANAGDVAECQRLVKSGIAVDTPDPDGDTALDWAIYGRHIDVVRALLDLGADVNHADDRRRTPLMFTATMLRGRSLQGTRAERAEIARILIEHGADVNRATGDGSAVGDGATTLHFAAADKNAGLVRVLLAAGANPTLKSNHGYTPLDVAKFPDFAPNDEVIAALQKPAQ